TICDALQCSLCLFLIRSCWNTQKCVKPVDVSRRGLGIRGFELQRSPEKFLIRQNMKTRRHDAHDGVWGAFQAYCASDDVGAGCEFCPPERIAQNSDISCAGPILVVGEHAAGFGLHAKHMKEVCIHFAAADAFRYVLTCEVECHR